MLFLRLRLLRPILRTLLRRHLLELLLFCIREIMRLRRGRFRGTPRRPDGFQPSVQRRVSSIGQVNRLTHQSINRKFDALPRVLTHRVPSGSTCRYSSRGNRALRRGRLLLRRLDRVLDLGNVTHCDFDGLLDFKKIISERQQFLVSNAHLRTQRVRGRSLTLEGSHVRLKSIGLLHDSVSPGANRPRIGGQTGGTPGLNLAPR